MLQDFCTPARVLLYRADGLSSTDNTVHEAIPGGGEIVVIHSETLDLGRKINSLQKSQIRSYSFMLVHPEK